MTYGLNRELFVEDGPAVQSARLAARRPAARLIRWRGLDADRRLRIVESALNAPANDLIDSYPVAL